ncbi:MAG: class I SAM-dependent methyltransferase [Roseobacter sp.]
MIGTRLSLALAGGGLSVPGAGRIAVFGAPPEADLSMLPVERVTVVQGFKPALDTWIAAGFDCVPIAEGRFAAAIVCLPRAKAEARALVAQAVDMTDGLIVIDGQKTDGVDSILRDMRKRTATHGPVVKAHGKMFWCDDLDTDAFAEWRAGPELTQGGFWTAPGVFSADKVDAASALLVDALPDKLGTQVADLGAGWGFLSAHILTRPDIVQAHLVEAGYMSVECARRNVTDARAVFHWDDATTWKAPCKLDSVIMNPPFHTTRAADPTLGQAFVAAAARILAPQGQLWMVANRHLPYETTLKAHFTNVFEIGGDARFKLFHAMRPKIAARNKR